MLIILIATAVSLACLVLAFVMLRRKRLIDDLPTSRAQGVFIGFVELKGTAESESPLTSYLSASQCVQYAWEVEEQSTETRVETYRDAQGRTQTRTVTTTKWTRVASGGECNPFYLKDDTGVIRIVPEGARLENVKVFDRTCGRSDPMYFGKGPAGEVAHSDHRRRFHEHAIPLHASLYVVGQAREREDVIAPEIAHDKWAPMFLISTRTEKQVSAGYGLWFALLAFGGLVAAVAGVAVPFLAGQSISESWRLLLLAGLAYLVALGIGWVWMVFNSLANLRQRVGQAWSEVDVQLRRRKDLIPNLAATVEGYSGHEREVQETVAALRSQLSATPPGVAGPDFKGFAPAIRAIVEKYPALKANEAFLSLQEGLSATEQRIALARDYYNQIATFYNTRLLIIPDRFVAALARLRPRALMTASDFERAEVSVSLAR